MEDRRDVGAYRKPCARHTRAVWGWLALAFAMLSGCQIYSADPISGRVVEKETGQPIEGAVVVAAWIPMGGMEGGNPEGMVQLLEAVTNSNGEYTIPGWGPKPYFGWGGMRSSSPQLAFFKYGFNPEIGGELQYLTTSPASHMKSSRNGKVIELERSSQSLSDYTLRIASLNSYLLNQVVSSKTCLWKKIPHLLLEVDRAKVVLKSAGVSFIPLRSLDELEREVSCGGVTTFVLENGR